MNSCQSLLYSKSKMHLYIRTFLLDLPWELREFDPAGKNRDPGWTTCPKMQQGRIFDYETHYLVQQSW